ncbi:ATP-binding protein [Streptomyces sp. SID3343]|nr:ATP-binding protein [Streptomyces sp. SID3343]MYV97625.1 ATP-binding protein [Streptomyces sp. SID3343]
MAARDATASPQPQQPTNVHELRLLRLLGGWPDTSATPAPVQDLRSEALREAIDRIPLRFRDARPEHPYLHEWIDAVLDQALPSVSGMRRISTGPSLLMVGGTGTGKTHQAYGAISTLIQSGCGMQWTAANAADLYAHLRPRHGHDSEAAFLRVIRSPLLLVDDLGAAKPSEWTEDITYRLVNHRYERMLPTLVTTNLAIADLRDRMGDRIASRLSEMTTRVVLAGRDRRRSGAA